MTEPESSLCIPTADVTNDTAESTEASTPTGRMEELYAAPRLPMAPTSPTATVTNDRRAEDFYAFFRSESLQEMRRNLERLAGSPQLDRHDLALLALMLDRCPSEIQRRLQADERDRNALRTILRTVCSCPEPPDPDFVQTIQRLAQAGPRLDY